MAAERKNRYSFTVSDEPMTLEEQIQYYLRHKRSLAIHGKRESLAKILPSIPYNFVLELNNETEYKDFFGGTRPSSDGSYLEKVPPAWYNEFCAYCKEHEGNDCALLIRGITKCEPSKQVWLNTLTDMHERALRPGYAPLPANAAVFVLVEDKEEADYAYHNVTEQVFRRLAHIFLDKDK